MANGPSGGRAGAEIDKDGRPCCDPAGFRGAYYPCPLLVVANFSGHEAVCHIKFPHQVMERLPSYLATVPPNKTRDHPEVRWLGDWMMDCFRCC